MQSQTALPQTAQSAQSYDLQKIFGMPNAKKFMPDEFETYHSLDLKNGSSQQELQNIQASVEQVMENHRQIYPSLNLLSQDELVRVVFSIQFQYLDEEGGVVGEGISYDDVNTFIAEGLIPSFPKTCKIRKSYDQEGGVELLMTDCCKLLKLKNSKLQNVDTMKNVAEFFKTLEHEIAEALKVLMLVSQVNLKTDNGDFSEQNFGQLPSQIIVTLYLVELTNKFENAVQSNQVKELVDELEQWIQNIAKRLKEVQRFNEDIDLPSAKPLAKGQVHPKVQLNILMGLAVNICAYRKLAQKLLDCESEQQYSQLWFDHPKWFFKNGIAAIKCQGTTIEYKYRLQETRQLLAITELSWESFKTFFTQDEDKIIHGKVGPAGTGKTETHIDSCWYLGISCAKVICSAEFGAELQQDYQARKYIGYVDSAHSIVFDEFNRCLPQFQQKIADQISQKPKQSNLFICITMNAGDPYRKEIIEDTKRLTLSTLQMTVPSKEFILENWLIYEGFSQNRTLASKLFQVVSYMEREESFHKYSYLDFGLRMMLKIRRGAGKIMRLGQEESFAVAVATRDVLVRSLPTQFQQQMLSYVSLTFLGASQLKLAQLQHFTTCKYANIVQSKYHHLYERLEQSNVNLVVRQQPFEVAQELTTFFKNIDVLESKVYSVAGCPLNGTEDQIKESCTAAFGHMNRNTWVDGYIPQIFREAILFPTVQHYIIVYGSLNPIWTDYLNTTLDDNKVLTLANGEKLPLGANTKFIFISTKEICDQSTPAFISRCATLNME